MECIIDDDGIGRELSKQYKAQYEVYSSIKRNWFDTIKA